MKALHIRLQPLSLQGNPAPISLWPSTPMQRDPDGSPQPTPVTDEAFMAGYCPRVADHELSERLGWSGAVVIEGPRACGKTSTARQVARSEALLDVDDEARHLARLEPAELLVGETPRLIDEWQLEPSVWNHVRRTVDDRQAKGQFILTGSAVPPDDITRHTGAGRFSRLRLRPMSLFELGHATGTVSLSAVLSGGHVRSPAALLTAREVAQVVCVGGWPGHLHSSADEALRANRDYLGEVSRVDVARVNGVRTRSGKGRSAHAVVGPETWQPPRHSRPLRRMSEGLIPR